MSRVLLLAYHFPPLGGPGTQRALKLVRYLPALGHDPAVVTGPGASAVRNHSYATAATMSTISATSTLPTSELRQYT